MIAVSPAEFALRGTVGEPWSEAGSVTIAAAGPDTLQWSVSSDVSWLHFDPPGGTVGASPREIAIRADQQALAAGEYSATITLSSPQQGVFPRILPFRLAVAPRFRVRADGGGDFATVQDAINASTPGTLIELVPGTYYERLTIGGRWLVLSSVDPSDPGTVASTVLDGSAGAPVIAFSGDEGPETAVRGLTVTNAAGNGGAAVVGAPYFGSRPARATIEHCRVWRNSCAALRWMQGRIADCEISENKNFNSGIVESGAGSIARCVIAMNAGSYGGLVGFQGWIDDCWFVGNWAIEPQEAGGAVASCYGRIRNRVFIGNRARSPGSAPRPNGGAIAASGGVLERCWILSNSADANGGGVDRWRGVIRDCIISGNTAAYGGGLYNGDAEMVNCVVAGNTATVEAGGSYNGPDLVHCTFADNHPSALGLAGGSSSVRSMTIENCIIRGRFGPASMHVGAYGALDVGFSDVEGGSSGVAVDPGGSLNWGEGNMDADPRFDSAGWVRLTQTSPCLDAGANFGAASDLDGVPRPLGDGFDLGAFERDPAHAALAVSPYVVQLSAVAQADEPVPPQSVRLAAAGGGTLNWLASSDAAWLACDPPEGECGDEAVEMLLRVDATNLTPGIHVAWVALDAPQASMASLKLPVVLTVSFKREVCPSGGDYARIQDAIDAARDVDTIIVCPGTYRENIRFNGKHITLRGTKPDDPEGVRTTVIDGGAAGSVVTFRGDEGPDTVLSGFTLTNGVGQNGGGIRVTAGAIPQITRCVIENCRASSLGGGVNVGDTAPISNCTIRTNRADGSGGGAIRFQGGAALITTCIFESCVSTTIGGALYMSNASPTIAECLVHHNSADTAGGGVYASGGSPIVRNTTIADNLTTSGGSSRGGGVYRTSSGLLTLQDCILWRNQAAQGAQLAAASSNSSIAVSYCDVQGGAAAAYVAPGAILSWGAENFTHDPLFQAGGPRPYQLRLVSRCVNTGDPGYVASPAETDLAGFPRVAGGRLDIGAYEFQGTPCIPCDTNCGGSVNQLDIQPFINALISHSGCPPCAADANGDGTLNPFDVQGFIECLIP